MILSTDSTANLPKEICETFNIRVLPMQLCIEDKVYDDLSKDLDSKILYEKMRTGIRVTTAKINDFCAQEYFERLLECGEDILHVGFSSKLSGATETIKQVVNSLNNSHTNKIAVIDSLNGGMGEGILLLVANKFMLEGLNFDEVVEKTENFVQKCCSYFTVDHLKYLVKGGRISKLKGTLGTVLQIKPIIKADENGKLVTCKKTITRKRALDELFKIVSKKITHKDLLFIGHTGCFAEAEKLATRFENELNTKPKIVEITQVLGSHCGPDTIAAFFISENRD